jgi:hypothetical protein
MAGAAHVLALALAEGETLGAGEWSRHGGAEYLSVSIYCA